MKFLRYPLLKVASKAAFLLTLTTATVTISFGKTPENGPALSSTGSALVTRQSGSRPALFIENSGQLADDAGKPHPEILFTTRSAGVQVYLSHTNIYYVFTKTEYPEGYHPGDKTARRDPAKEETLRQQIKTTIRRFGVQLEHANPNAEIVKAAANGYYENYYLPQCPKGVTAHTYSEVVYKDIYPGIDWVLYSNTAGQMKYNFIVHPGADPKQIQLHIDGADKYIAADGRLQMQTELGKVEEATPVSFSGEQSIATRFTQTGGGIGFDIAAYDAGNDLVIDPAVSWSTYYGGSDQEFANDCTIDLGGRLYVTGNTTSANFPVSNALQTSYHGSSDAFIVKLNNNGQALWATYYGGTDIDVANDCTTDVFGNIFITGETSSADFPLSSAIQNNYGGGSDAYVAKFSNSGSVLWATYYGGSNHDIGNSCTTDTTGNVYITGETSSLNFPVSNALQGSFNGAYDAFIAKFNSSGSVIWSTYYGGSGNDVGYQCTIDPSGNLYVVGSTSSSDFPVSNAVQNTNGGAMDAFVAKFSSNGSVFWSTYYGGTQADGAGGCATDASGNLFIAGYTYSSDFPVYNALQSAYGGNEDGYVAKFNSAGTVLWTTYYGGSNNDVFSSCAIDFYGNVYITGATSSVDFPVSNAVQSSYGGSQDACMVKFSKNGFLLWATFYGGNSTDGGDGCATDLGGDAYMVGNTFSANFPVSNAAQGTYGGNSDAFAAKFFEPAISVGQILPAGFKIYPNPASSEIVIDGLKKDNSIQIMNVLGKVVYRKEAEGGKEHIDFAPLEPGIYFFYFTDTQGNTWSSKVVKQ